MARNRTFKWVDPSGNSLLLSDRVNGFWVLKGVTGLGMPQFTTDKEPLPMGGSIVRGVRPSARTIFIPLDITGSTRQDFLSRKQTFGYMLDPERGDGWLYVTDGGATYRIRARYAGGLEGDETDAGAGEEGACSWSKVGLQLDADMFFELVTPTPIGPYGYNSGVSFFPILPVRLSSKQVLSDISQVVITNRIKNPSFELNTTTGWSGAWFSSPVPVGTPSSLNPVTGTKSCRIDFPTAVAGDSGRWFTQADGVALVSGQRYTIVATVTVPFGQPPVQITSWDGASAYTQTNDQPERLSCEFTASFSTNPLLTVIQKTAGGANANGGYVFLDSTMLVQGSDPGGYIDGDQPNCHWNGTPHNSTSFRDATYAPTIINNPGTQIAYPIIHVTGPGSLVDLYNRDTGQHVTLNYAIPAGVTVHFDMGSKTVLLDDGTNLYPYLTADDFWGLQPNNNLVSLSLANADVGSRIEGQFYTRLNSIV